MDRRILFLAFVLPVVLCMTGGSAARGSAAGGSAAGGSAAGGSAANNTGGSPAGGSGGSAVNSSAAGSNCPFCFGEVRHDQEAVRCFNCPFRLEDEDSPDGSFSESECSHAHKTCVSNYNVIFHGNGGGGYMCSPCKKMRADRKRFLQEQAKQTSNASDGQAGSSVVESDKVKSDKVESDPEITLEFVFEQWAEAARARQSSILGPMWEQSEEARQVREHNSRILFEGATEIAREAGSPVRYSHFLASMDNRARVHGDMGSVAYRKWDTPVGHKRKDI